MLTLECRRPPIRHSTAISVRTFHSLYDEPCQMAHVRDHQGETFYFDNSLHQAGPVIGYNMINNPHRFNVEWWLRFTMPLYLYRTAAEAVGSTHHIAEAAKLAKSVQQGVRISNLFKAFTKNEFFYETDQVQRYVADATAQMVTAGTSAADPEKYRPAENPFNVDSREIIWNTYLRSFSYGIR